MIARAGLFRFERGERASLSALGGCLTPHSRLTHRMTVHHPFSYQLGLFTFTGFGIAVLLAFLDRADHLPARARAPRPRSRARSATSCSPRVIGGLLGAKIYYVIVVARHHDAVEPRRLRVLGRVDRRHHRGVPASSTARSCTSCASRTSRGSRSPPRTRLAAPGAGRWATTTARPWAYAIRRGVSRRRAALDGRRICAAFHSSIPAGIAPNTVLSVYPTQLLEVALGFVMFSILWRSRATTSTPRDGCSACTGARRHRALHRRVLPAPRTIASSARSPGRAVRSRMLVIAGLAVMPRCAATYAVWRAASILFGVHLRRRMTFALAATAAVLGAAALMTRGAMQDARACTLPCSRSPPHATPRPFAPRRSSSATATRSCRERPIAGMIAVESWDRGHTLTNAVERRRRTVARGPAVVCESQNGFSVVFHVYDPMDSRTGHVVSMGRAYGGHAAARRPHPHRRDRARMRAPLTSTPFLQ